MVDVTTIRIHVSTLGLLDRLRVDKESNDDVIRRIIKRIDVK